MAKFGISIYLYQDIRINTTKALRDQKFSSKRNSEHSTLFSSSPHPSNEAFIFSRPAHHILLHFLHVTTVFQLKEST